MPLYKIKLLTIVSTLNFRSPQSHNWQSVADRINELEKQYTNQNQNTKNQRYTYLDPSKTTRVANTALKAFQKNAVQSYFERQQLNLNASARDSMRQNSPNPVHSSPANNQARPQSLPIQKTNASNNQMQMIAQTRSSLPAKLSQLINISGQLSPSAASATSPGSASSHNRNEPQSSLNSSGFSDIASNRNSMTMLSPTQQQAQLSTIYHQPVFSSIVQSEPLPTRIHQGILDSRIMTIEHSDLQSANESGVPPPPPRRTRTSMPVRR